MLQIENLQKSFNSTTVLKDINLTVKDTSKIIGLVGGSGSGKTTLLRSLVGLEKPDSGRILFNGSEDFKTGLVFQDFQLFPHMSVFDNITYAPMLKDKRDGVLRDREEEAIQLLTKLGIEDKVNCNPDELSGGQKQRVALARSLIVEPELLMLDEPSSGLDTGNQRNLTRLLKSISQKIGTTMVMASHDLSFLLNTCDEIVGIKDGKVVLQNHTKLSKKGIEDVIDLVY